jgi:hypothetical protein
MRIYDPRVGRFLSVDPIAVKYPELTPYQFASNTPIDAIDLDGLEAVTSKQSNVYFIKLQNVNMSFILRQPGKSFTQTAAGNNNPKLVDVTINTQQYDKKTLWAAFMYNTNLASQSPQTPGNYESQGLNVKNGKNIEGRSAPETFYLAQKTANGSWSAGYGDVPADSHMGIGGGFPLYINGLKYGDKNVYSNDAPDGLPTSGPPGSVGETYIVQRSNGVYRDQNKSNMIGKTILGYNSKTGDWIVVAQQAGRKGMTLDQIRDNLIKQGYTAIVGFDGSTSSTVVRDKTTIVTPSALKNNTIPSGVTLSVPQKP